jgi:hypothetical protein
MGTESRDEVEDCVTVFLPGVVGIFRVGLKMSKGGLVMAILYELVNLNSPVFFIVSEHGLPSYKGLFKELDGHELLLFKGSPWCI